MTFDQFKTAIENQFGFKASENAKEINKDLFTWEGKYGPWVVHVGHLVKFADKFADTAFRVTLSLSINHEKCTASSANDMTLTAALKECMVKSGSLIPSLTQALSAMSTSSS